VHRRQHRDRILVHVDAGEDARGFGDARQARVDHLRTEMFEVQVDVILVRPTPRPSRISMVIERETTSREARSLALGA
jgi:hypothetical protein